MQMSEKITKSKYFSAIRMKNSQILDSLTNTLSRKYIISYVQYLLNKRIPFTLGMIDLDNFKYVNDHYGHAAGDTVLSTVSKRIMDVMDDCASIGRYGGDEFMVVLEGVSTYEKTWDLIHKIYLGGIRKPVVINDDLTLNVTCTTGCSTYPADAKNYKDLFANCDKCLYRGKQKGRNCYIIYVESLHNKIDVKSQAKASMLDRITHLYDAFETPDKKRKIVSAMEYILKDCNISGVAYYHKHRLKEYYVKHNYGEPPQLPEKLLNKLETCKCYKLSDCKKLKSVDDELFEFCYRNNLLSFVIYKLEGERDCDYVMFYDSDFARIWQNDDETIFLIFTKTLGSLVGTGPLVN